MDVDGALPGWTSGLMQSPLLAAAVIAMVVTLAGSLIGGATPRAGRIMRAGGNLALIAVVGMTVLQVARLSNPALDLALPQVGLPAQRIVGSETRIPLSPDGHYWIEAMVNGEPRRFLVDTGATLTAVSEVFAGKSGIQPSPGRMPVQLRTASGTLMARIATIGEFSFGNVVARDLDAVIVPGMEGMNVLGMNFLSRLKGWRVEDGELVLVPNHPQGAPKA
ncbi:TIGR02281 family clan AA aspartic protease [Novosphingobium sp. Gsoil 351]|uniref:retropepsin-like aspartic protease family protein n=1 Tax=Novosphingobium sp. Gsoil 351 TaxID=2675225 RepID=UPI0012B49C18|nr:TIGR02281 family clan AA aspartic protease [Novosphingobium sp. Gsoil 351]QGN56326.1 TIGR02281 family clan AA aspartic protease [Novosphingobium sp. Gsoil 351]